MLAYVFVLSSRAGVYSFVPRGFAVECRFREKQEGVFADIFSVCSQERWRLGQCFRNLSDKKLYLRVHPNLMISERIFSPHK